MNEIYQLLWQLGANATYTGFRQTAAAVYLCMQQQERLQLVTKRLYPEVAKKHNTNWRAVEHNIRTISAVAWKKNRPLLEQLAEISLPKRPNVSYFLAILSGHLLIEQTDDKEAGE